MEVEGGAIRGISWSPSGDLVAQADRGGTESWQLYVRRPSGEVHALSVSEGERVQHHLSWNACAPDGGSVAFMSKRASPRTSPT